MEDGIEMTGFHKIEIGFNSQTLYEVLNVQKNNLQSIAFLTVMIYSN